MLVWILVGVIVLGVLLTILDVRTMIRLNGEIKFRDAALRGAQAAEMSLKAKYHLLDLDRKQAAVDYASLLEIRNGLQRSVAELRKENDQLLDFIISDAAKSACKCDSKPKATSKKKK